MTDEPLEVGQEVRVYPLHGGDAPTDGWPATVTDVGDELATAAVFFPGGTRAVVFSLRDFRSTRPPGQWRIVTEPEADLKSSSDERGEG